MKVKDILNSEFTLVAGSGGIEKEISNVYVCDLLSFVMSHVKSGSAWITIQTHVNVVAVALMTEISCIIICEGEKLDENAKVKADEENIPVISFSGTSYDAAIKLSEMIK
ncbi:DRTGG domain-containing protein [Thermoanaerobacterium thermosaccharolyticum]|mgnify:CR=1 FL=1|uniref:DRTGG domain protein n=3 Tax=Thermoanaerobacterium thermosaccharolyticum TaxID=1517 RepID=D9TNM8_THETC|nr:DRTGG domain-containing protein [Thermoanaerobacterium thermosaccharolyticum]TCW41944.1 DRTGG domain-containing protein [Thermohydrogenium kirishiense]ADL68634.1 DRTGG domain protein [Thermoanaerobacterium thermosaccharolyticum DSM 571]AGB18718.1 DRTGG domain-containing protein [Thermoanaerobacterium thermosaccharolyticum M0795]AST56394.1 DRTGG domain-containing protein [Thermoanaerobacterium thermosaccharolyticum]KAA5806773.1 AraC family transcriptional regulator [Thermoanaerobacterium the